MGAIKPLGDTFLRDFVVPGVPASGDYDPAKSAGRAVFRAIDAEMDALKSSQVAGAVAYPTQAALFANLAPGVGAKGEVFADSDPAKRGVYSKVGASGTGSWTRISDLAAVEQAKAIAGKLDAADGQLTGTDEDRLPNLIEKLVTDEAGSVALAVNEDGDVEGRLSRLSVARTWMNGYSDPKGPLADGARGTITEAKREPGSTRWRLWSDYGGSRMPFVMRTDIFNPGMVLDTSNEIWAFANYGQSWEVQMLPLPGYEGQGDVRALSVSIAGDTDLLPPLGTAFFANQIGDFQSLSLEVTANNDPANAAGNIGWVAAQSFAKRIEQGHGHIRPVLSYCHAYPGQQWPGLKPGGATEDGAGAQPWAAGLIMDAKVAAVAASYAKVVKYAGVGLTHGAYEDGAPDSDGVSDYYAILTAVLAAYDARNLPTIDGAPIVLFTDQTAPVSGAVKAQDNILRQMDFYLAHPTRIQMIGPRYPYPFADDIHHTAEGYRRIGELRGLHQYFRMVRRVPSPPLRVTGVAVSGSTVVVTVNAPPGFGGLALDTASIAAAPGHGFHYRRVSNGAEIAVTGVAVTGANQITLTLSSAPAAGAAYEFSYAYRGPGATPGTHSGVWGNVKRIGPASLFATDETIDAWLCVHRQEITV